MLSGSQDVGSRAAVGAALDWYRRHPWWSRKRPTAIRSHNKEHYNVDRQAASVEFVGTFWLVFGGCGSAVIAAAFPNVGLRADRHRPRAHADPPDRHSGDERVGESRPQHGPAWFVGGWALAQLWLFWPAPLGGGLLSGVAYRLFAEPRPEVTVVARSMVAAPVGAH